MKLGYTVKPVTESLRALSIKLSSMMREFMEARSGDKQPGPFYSVAILVTVG